MVRGHIKGLISQVHDQINDARSNLDVNSALGQFCRSVDLFILLLLLLDLNFALSFTTLGLKLALLLHLFILSVSLCLSLHSSLLPAFKEHLLALSESLISICVVLLLFLLLHQLLNEHVLLLLLVKSLLSLGLVNGKLASSAFSLLAGEVTLLLGLLDLIHGSRETKVLDLAGRDALLFLHALDGIFHVHIAIDAQLLQILFKFAKTVSHFSRGIIKLLAQFGLIEVDLAILEVLLPGDVVSPGPLILLPVLAAFFLPLLHEVLVFSQFGTIFLALTLLHGLNQVALIFITSDRSVKEILLSHLELNQVEVLAFLFHRSHVLATDLSWLDRACKSLSFLHVCSHLLVECANFEPSHSLFFQLISGCPLSLLNRQLELIEQPEGRTSLLLHDVVGHFTIEADFQGAKGIFNQVEIVHFGLFVRPIAFC